MNEERKRGRNKGKREKRRVAEVVKEKEREGRDERQNRFNVDLASPLTERGRNE